MAYLSLYRKYRPQTFDEIVGQSHVAGTLANAIVEDRVAHAYLFTGPRGTGKTSTARILAKALNCDEGPTPSPCGICNSCRSIADGSSLDVIEMDAASHSKVDEIRDILAGVPLATAGGRKKVYVIDEVHMLSSGSFNALLKTLEEPPSHVLFILATTEAHKVLPTIVSRTQRFDFRRVPTDLLEQHLAHIAKLEEFDIEPAALSVIARHAEGGVRDALSALDQLSSIAGHIGELDAESLLGDRDEDRFVELFDAMAAGDVGSVFLTLNSLVSAGADPRQLVLGALSHARSLLLLRTAPDADGLLDASVEDVAQLSVQSERFVPGTLIRIMDLFGKALTEMRNTPNHRLLLEVAAVRAAAPDTDPSPNGLLGRIERLERRMGISEDAASAGPVAPARAAVAPPVAAAPQEGAARAQGAAPPAVAPAPSKQTRSKPKKEPKGEPAATEVAAAESVADPSAPQPERAMSPGAPSPGVPAEIGLAHLKDAWHATMGEVGKRSKRIQGYLNPSRPVQFEEGTLLIEVQSAFHEATMTEERNRSVLTDALHSALGIKPALRFVARGAAPAPAEDHGGGEADYVEAASEPGEAHDPVELVKKGLGAEVVEERTPS